MHKTLRTEQNVRMCPNKDTLSAWRLAVPKSSSKHCSEVASEHAEPSSFPRNVLCEVRIGGRATPTIGTHIPEKDC